jgi:hypothetical protein
MEELSRNLERHKCRWKNNTNINFKSETWRCELQTCGAEWEKACFFNRVKLIANFWLLKLEG